MSVTIDNHSGSGQDISNDVTSLSVTNSRGSQDITGLDSSAIERLLLLSDSQISMTGVFNIDANMSHAVLSTVHSFSGTRTVVIDYGTPVLTLECVLTAYDISRAADGSLTWTATMQLADGTAPAWT